MKVVTALVDRLFFAAGVLIFLQLPHFIDQYTQRAGGFYDAERVHMEKYQAIADENFAGDIERLIREFRSSENRAVRQTGEQVAATRQRLVELQKGLQTLEQEELFARIAYLARHMDYDLAKGTLRVFKPGVPFSLGAFACGVIGGMLFSLLFHLVRLSLIHVFGRPDRRSTSAG